MKILVACEFSATVREAFYKRGHYVWSCDYKQTEKPGQFGYHYQGDVRDMLSDSWDMLIAHPPCTYFSRAGIQFIHTQRGRKKLQEEAFEFVKLLWAAKIKKKCLENPVGWLCTNWKRPTQKIHPWYFGDNEMKETCLWLWG